MKKFIPLLIVCILMTGCVEKKYIEKLGIVTTIGFDLLDDGFLQGTMAFFQFDPNAQNVSQIVTSTAKTSKGIRQDGNLKSSKKLVSGQLRLVVFGRKAAEKGLGRIIDTLARDAAISDILYLTVAEDRAQDIIQSNKMEDAPDIGAYLHGLIEKNIDDEVLPPSTLHHFTHDFHDVGLDPTLPMLGLSDNKPVIFHLALFQGDQFVTEIPVKQGFYLKLILDRFQAGHLELKLPKDPFLPHLRGRVNEDVEGVYITMDEIRSKSNITLTDPNALKYKVDIRLSTRIIEISEDIKLQERKVLKLMEEQLSKQLEENLKEFTELIIENKVDPVGFGRMYENSSRNIELTEKKWREMIPNIEVDFNVNAKILRHGIIK
ncbi:Ger(x)C family spore germination protein [Pontibacillus marinus]|uniref:Spore germination protein n=1 Tax=Pontibacillus marinus BH030004 = DSM 16465 TaxID=1385511 RepID=A0A0A5FW76_9BACI|nr:Ger(x)C family spore germination protein [Pontibacillus marinus]KGX83283.1 hypothetical protein N783_05090 [Pontibacillus marinus BH030004 = DSM 16465]